MSVFSFSTKSLFFSLNVFLRMLTSLASASSVNCLRVRLLHYKINRSTHAYFTWTCVCFITVKQALLQLHLRLLLNCKTGLSTLKFLFWGSYWWYSFNSWELFNSVSHRFVQMFFCITQNIFYCTNSFFLFFTSCVPLLEITLGYFLVYFVVFFCISWELFVFFWNFALILWIIFCWSQD